MGTSSNSAVSSSKKEEKQDDLFTVITCELYKCSNNEKYIINQLSEVKHKKLKGLFLLNQCTSDESQKSFFESESLPESSLIYLFSSSSKVPTLKTYEEIESFQPFKDPKFNKIIVLSTKSLNHINISNLEISKNIQENGGIKIGMILDFSKKVDNSSQIERNTIKNNMIISISSCCFEEADLKPDNETETFKIKGNINNELINIIVKGLFNGTMPKEGDDNSEIINHQIKHIMIKNATINDNDSFDKLINVLNYFPIQLFTFCENVINSDINWHEKISQILCNNYSIRYIDFHSQNITDEMLPPLIQAISDKNIKIIDLGENNLTSKGCELISEYLKTINGSKKLYFLNNSKLLFKSDGVRLITEGLVNNENIELLDFSNMDITGCGPYLGDIIKNKSNFKFLYLNNCKLNCKDFKCIFEEIEKSESIKEIDVSNNNMGGDKALQYIANAIKNNKSLTYLGMKNINLNMDNYEIIFEAIKYNICISHYCLSYNPQLKPKILLNFFLGLTQVKYLEFIPFGPLDKDKELTLEEKKIIEQFKDERKDMEFIYKENIK